MSEHPWESEDSPPWERNSGAWEAADTEAWRGDVHFDEWPENLMGSSPWLSQHDNDDDE